MADEFDYKSRSYGATQPAQAPPQNAHQLIQLMYKQDASEVSGNQVKQMLQYNQSIRSLNDAAFMKHLGWYDDQKGQIKKPQKKQAASPQKNKKGGTADDDNDD